MSYPWPVEAVVTGDHYITAIGPVGDAAAVACRCGWFAVADSGKHIWEKVIQHMEGPR